MNGPAHVLHIEESTRDRIEAALDCPSFRYSRMTDVEPALARIAETSIECVVAGPDGDSLAVLEDVRDRLGPLPVVVLADDERLASEALSAGATEVLSPGESPAVLRARIECAVETYRADPPADGDDRGFEASQRRTERTLERLLEATRDLMAAEDERAVAATAVRASSRVLDLSRTGIHLVDGEGASLEPVAYTDAVEESLGTVPTLQRDDSLAWEVFESDEDRIYEDVHGQTSAHNPETDLRSEMIFSLGDHGVMIIASDDIGEFGDADVYFAKLLAATAEAALDRAAREAALEYKNAQLEEFVGVVSHDLRNPLGIAEGRVDLARRTEDTSHLEAVERSHARIREIIEELLVLAREGQAVGTTQPVLVGTVAREAWESIDARDATLSIGDDRTVQADRNRLQQLFENAFRNAVEHGSTGSRNKDSGDAVEHGSTGSQNGRSDDGPDVRVTVEACDRGFAIADDGPGIPPEERESVFEPGYTDSEDGTGFGMTIIENIVEGHDWRCVIEESDQGGLRLVIVTDEEQGPNAR